MPGEKLFQRVWPPMMIGVMFVLEVVWIVYLVHLSTAFVRFAFLRPYGASIQYQQKHEEII